MDLVVRRWLPSGRRLAFVLRSLRSHGFDERGGHRQQRYVRCSSCSNGSSAHGAKVSLWHRHVGCGSVGGSMATLYSIASMLLRKLPLTFLLVSLSMAEFFTDDLAGMHKEMS